MSECLFSVDQPQCRNARCLFPSPGLRPLTLTIALEPSFFFVFLLSVYDWRCDKIHVFEGAVSLFFSFACGKHDHLSIVNSVELKRSGSPDISGEPSLIRRKAG